MVSGVVKKIQKGEGENTTQHINLDRTLPYTLSVYAKFAKDIYHILSNTTAILVKKFIWQIPIIFTSTILVRSYQKETEVPDKQAADPTDVFSACFSFSDRFLKFTKFCLLVKLE